MKLHGGTIEVASTLGEGTTFRVRIPFGVAHLPKESLRAVPVHRRLGATSAFVEEALRWLPDPQASAPVLLDAGTSPADDRRFAPTFGARIVLADDNADMRDVRAGICSRRSMRSKRSRTAPRHWPRRSVRRRI